MYTSDGELYFSDYEKAEIEICLNCTKPVEECYGMCEFKNTPTKQPVRTVKIKDVVNNGIKNNLVKLTLDTGERC